MTYHTDILTVLQDQIGKNKERLIVRLSRNLADTVDGCVVWTRSVNNDGYGYLTFRHRGKHAKIYVHRLFWVLMHGRNIPAGMEVDHECRTRRCVRHLQCVTSAENKWLRDQRRRGS